MRTEGEALAKAFARVCEEKKGAGILVLDLRSFSYVTDFFVIATGQTPRHLRALSEAVAEEAERLGASSYGAEPVWASGWALLDFVDVVIHLFTPGLRGYYELDQLWGDARRLEWREV